MEYVLKTNSLCKNYGHFKALNGLSMNVPKGSIYGLSLIHILLNKPFGVFFRFFNNQESALVLCLE